MPAPESVRRAYQATEALVASLREYVRTTLQPFCTENRYLFFDRIKQLESLSEKIESGRTARWSDLDDQYACTIVVPTAHYEPRVVEALERYFASSHTRSRNTAQKAPDVFRFDTTRVYLRLRPEAADTRLPGLDRVLFEVQIPTVFEFAWTTVTRDLVYKGDTVDWRKQRLAAQLKAVVEQAEMIIESSEYASAALPQSSWPEVDCKSKIVDVFTSLITQGLILPEIAPQSWNRFADNVYSLVRSYTNNPRRMPAAVDEFLDFVSAKISESAHPPMASGTLFQMVLGYVASPDFGGSIDGIVIAESEELSTMYGIRSVAKPFVFDLPEGAR